MMTSNKKITLLAMLPIMAALSVAPILVYAQQDQMQQQQPTSQQPGQTTIITTTTQPTQMRHHFHSLGHWLWKHGLANPGGLFQGNNTVALPAQSVAQTVINNCPSASPILLSTGQCIDAQQLVTMIQQGQVQVGGTVQAQGQTIVGEPTALSAQGSTNIYGYLGHVQQQFPGMTITNRTTITTTTTPAEPGNQQAQQSTSP